MKTPNHCLSKAIVLGALACDEPASTNTTTSVMVDTHDQHDRNDDVIVSLTMARCHREVNCNNIGVGKKYINDAACFRAVDQNMRLDLHQTACPIVDTGVLRSCLDAIENKPCGTAIDVLDQLAACHALCKN